MQPFKSLTMALKTGYSKLLLCSASLYASATHAQSLSTIDLTRDQSGGKNLQNAMEQSGSLIGTGSSFVLLVWAFIGLIVTSMSVYTIYKASKEEREKPTSAVVGIFVGGALLAIPTIMWMARNSMFGAA